MLSWQIIKEFIDTSEPIFREMGDVYAFLPDTRCLRRCHCCALLPDTTFVEALSAFHSLSRWERTIQQQIFTRLVGYFFSNAFKITACPFFEEDQCIIYPERFFGCRAYGLWSPAHYTKRAEDSRQARQHFAENWRRLGVSLPGDVIDFHLPYCGHVTVREGTVIDDMTLEKLGDRLNVISEYYGEWNRLFIDTYFSDISFLATSLVFGTHQATRMKFTVVRESLLTGNDDAIIQLVEGLPDIDRLMEL